MKRSVGLRCFWYGSKLSVPGLVVAALAIGRLAAFPPAPSNTLFGLVRDQLGNPVMDANAMIMLTNAAGTGSAVVGYVQPDMAPGVNYQVEIPMDSGVTADLYTPSAMMPATPFRMVVVYGGVTNLPIEMVGNFATLATPGSHTRVDLTLGTSSDGVLPDAWKRAVIQAAQLNIPISSIQPNGMFPGTGLTYYQVYVAGTYYFGPTNGFVLNMKGFDGASAQFSFVGVKGRSYWIQGRRY